LRDAVPGMFELVLAADCRPSLVETALHVDSASDIIWSSWLSFVLNGRSEAWRVRTTGLDFRRSLIAELALI
jgi:hypothetical protein